MLCVWRSETWTLDVIKRQAASLLPDENGVRTDLYWKEKQILVVNSLDVVFYQQQYSNLQFCPLCLGVSSLYMY